MSKEGRFIVQTRTKKTKESTLSHYVVLTKTHVPIYTCCILELPWLDNQEGESCIPADVYEVEVLDSSPSFNYPHFHILNVPDRTWIKTHGGNYTRQIEGCQLPGNYFKDIDKDGEIDVAQSMAALKKLVSLMPKKFTLYIQEL